MIYVPTQRLEAAAKKAMLAATAADNSPPLEVSAVRTHAPHGSEWWDNVPREAAAANAVPMYPVDPQGDVPLSDGLQSQRVDDATAQEHPVPADALLVLPAPGDAVCGQGAAQHGHVHGAASHQHHRRHHQGAEGPDHQQQQLPPGRARLPQAEADALRGEWHRVNQQLVHLLRLWMFAYADLWDAAGAAAANAMAFGPAFRPHTALMFGQLPGWCRELVPGLVLRYLGVAIAPVDERVHPYQTFRRYWVPTQHVDQVLALAGRFFWAEDGVVEVPEVHKKWLLWELGRPRMTTVCNSPSQLMSVELARRW